MKAGFRGRFRFLLFEADGDFNPGWAVFCTFSFLIIVINVIGFLAVEVDTAAWPVLVALLTTDVLMTAIGSALTVNMARAKVISATATKGAGSIAGVGGGGAAGVAVNLFGDNPREDDERDEADL